MPLTNTQYDQIMRGYHHLPVDIVGGAQAHPGQILAALLPGQLLAARGQGQQIPHPQALEAGRLLKAVAHPQAGPLGDTFTCTCCSACLF